MMPESAEPIVGVTVWGSDDQLVSALLAGLKPLSPVKAPFHKGFNMFGIGPTLADAGAEIYVGIKPISP